MWEGHSDLLPPILLLPPDDEPPERLKEDEPRLDPDEVCPDEKERLEEPDEKERLGVDVPAFLEDEGLVTVVLVEL